LLASWRGAKDGISVLHAAWDINVGVGVDVHVHRITNRFRWHKPPTKNPEETRLNLQSWSPTEFHKQIDRRPPPCQLRPDDLSSCPSPM
ncbi:hypothetical protein F5148DRAFT_1232232, partial [Russula earlei]